MADSKRLSGVWHQKLWGAGQRVLRAVDARGDGEAEVSIEVGRELFHASGAVHGSVYFKLLDDAAFFAVH